MIDGINTRGFYISKRMWRGRFWPVDITHHCRIGTKMHNTAEYGKVWVPTGVNGYNKAYRFKTCKAINKISAVKPFPVFYIAQRKMLHAYIMHKKQKGSVP